MSEYLFEFYCTINPPTKNIERYLSTRKGIRYKNKKYHDPWNTIESLMYEKQFGISKYKFDLLQPEKKIELLNTLTDQPVILSLWNGFKRQDLSNTLTELQDRLQGIAYQNDRQIKELHLYKDDNPKEQYFKVIVELLNP